MRQSTLNNKEGLRFGMLLVVKRAPKKPGKKHVYWECLCDCGNTANVYTGYLGKPTRSCGCSARVHQAEARAGDEITGKKFGRLTILGFVPNAHGTRGKWRASCDCGKQILVFRSNLTKGNSASCGCLRNEINSLEPGEAAFNRLLSEYRAGAASRGYTWDLSPAEFRSLTSRPCHYCARPPSKVKRVKRKSDPGYTYSGIDREDNTIGYVVSNCVPCCMSCNISKGTYSVDEFLFNSLLIASHQLANLNPAQ